MNERRCCIAIAILAYCCIVGCAAQVCAQSSDQPTATIANPLEAQPLDRLSATRDRPLFSPTRRTTPPPPPPPPEQPPVAVVPQPPNLTLSGIVMDDEGARAIIHSSATKADRVQVGDDIGGWKVVQIDGRHLVLSLDGRLATFTLFSNESTQQLPRESDGRAGNVTDQAPPASVPAPSTSQPTEGQPATPRRHRRQ